MDNLRLTRRTFLAGTATLATGCAVTSKSAKGYRKRPVSPNEKLNIAAIGIGGKGDSNISGCRNENIVALCDVDGRQGTGNYEKYPNAKRYKDFRVMLEKQKDIDAVLVSTPDHVHAIASLMAMELGKHVYCEKPLTHNIFEARKMAQYAKRYKVATQMGNQGHSGGGVRNLCEMVWSGAIGPVREAHAWTNRPVWPQGILRPRNEMAVPSELDWDLWLGPAPWRPYHDAYLPFKWRGWWEYGCGALGDMGCHILDPVNWALKLCPPTSVEAVMMNEVNTATGPASACVRYEFPAREDMPPLTLYWYEGGKRPPRPEGIPEGQKLGDDDNGSLLIGDNGFITAGCYGDNARLLPDEKMKDYKMPPQILPRVGDHHANWIEACKGGEPACSNFSYAGPFTEIVLLGNLAMRTIKKLEWDGVRMEVTNDVSANDYVRREYRRGWEI